MFVHQLRMWTNVKGMGSPYLCPGTIAKKEWTWMEMVGLRMLWRGTFFRGIIFVRGVRSPRMHIDLTGRIERETTVCVQPVSDRSAFCNVAHICRPFSAIGELQRTECKDGTCRDWYEKTLLENQRVASLCNFFPWFADCCACIVYIYIYIEHLSSVHSVRFGV